MNLIPDSRLHVVICLLLSALACGAVSHAGNSEEETLKRIQQSKYSRITGVWQIRLNEEISQIEAGFKSSLPNLDYKLVDEKRKDQNNLTLVYRGQGDTKLVLKLKATGHFTRLSIRYGLTGSHSESAQIFGYVYRKM